MVESCYLPGAPGPGRRLICKTRRSATPFGMGLFRQPRGKPRARHLVSRLVTARCAFLTPHIQCILKQSFCLLKHMTLFNPKKDISILQEQLANDQGRRVVCYCAAWCRTCDGYAAQLESLATRLEGWTFIWVDIEDSPEWLGDEDIEDFPTILVEDAEGIKFWGVQLPYVEHLERLLQGAHDLPPLDAGPGSIATLISQSSQQGQG